MDDFHKQPTVPDLQVGEHRSFPLPKKIGPYKIESLLNKGGMSVLYLASSPETAQPVVVKVLLPKYLKNKEISERFLKEAQIIGMSNHPNIVRLYGQGRWEKGLYIAMEFIQGISLRQFIQQKSLTQKRGLEIVLQVASALCHLHTHGIIHRDLKPENILITETGEIKVIDFGIAQLHTESGRLTQRKKFMGTPVYMSPEQKENPLQISFSSDIYSLGIITYELILGRLSHGVIHLSLLPKALRQILEKAMRIDPKERYQDMVEFITDVSRYTKLLSEKTEEGEEEFSEEIEKMIQASNALLIPSAPPYWPACEIGLAVQNGMGLYLDFFPLQQNRYCIILAEPTEVSLTTLSITSHFRGLFRMGVQLFFQNEKKEEHPIQFLRAIHANLTQDSCRVDFKLSFLSLNLDKNQLIFISCHSSSLLHLPEGSQTIRTLTTPNPSLGINAAVPFLEITDNWNSGDTLILPSSELTLSDDSIETVSLLSSQHKAQHLLQTAHTSKKAAPNRASAVITIHRLF